MPTDHENQRSAKSIRTRAQELRVHGEQGTHTADAEILAALADGTVSFEDIDDETLDRCLKELGTNHVIGAITQEAGVTEKSVPVVIERTAQEEPAFTAIRDNSRHPELSLHKMTWWGTRSSQDSSASVPPALSWWRANSAWVAVAASVAFVSTVVMWTGKHAPDSPSDPLDSFSLAFAWPSKPPVDPSMLTPWGPAKPPLSNGLPDFSKGGGTLGAGVGDDRVTAWRLATVIVRTEEGTGSGAFISADGWLLTNYHVVEGPAQKAAITGEVPTVEVILAQKAEGRLKPRLPIKARVYRVDAVHDLALLRVEPLPEGMKDVPFFRLASEVREGEECFVIGSQGNGPAWWVRSGNVSVLFDFPNELSQMAAGAATIENSVERTRATVIVTDTRISGGDSGGPLLNGKGELIGLTFATPVNRVAGSVGWHIALEHVRSIVSPLPSQPEGVPFDPWTVGLSQARLGTPQQADGDRDGRVDTLVYSYTADVTDNAGHTAPQTVAFTFFIDFAQRTPSKSDVPDLIPTGIWSFEERGRFRHDVFITVRADDVLAVGYVNGDGIVDEIRIGVAKEDRVTVVWRREKQGQWRASRSEAGTRFMDFARISEVQRQRIGLIYRNLTGAQQESQPAKPKGPQRPEDGARRGPNKL